MGKLSFFAVVLVCSALGAANFISPASAVYASFNIYDSSGIGYDLNTASAYCATVDGNQPYSWRSQYPWTAYYQIESNCGKCLLVTNPDTGVSLTLMIVDQCSNGGLDIEQRAFNTLDTDGAGNARGHLDVQVSFVSC